MAWAFFAQYPERQAQNYVKSVGGKPVRTGKIAERVKPSVYVGGSVDKKQRLGAVWESVPQGHEGSFFWSFSGLGALSQPGPVYKKKVAWLIVIC
jgi:hypothetical protein